ncbi:hypothetical protein NE237_006050 [Protea cynaroides]|uniref:F-box domain-containing protein n=1 Tax=Protea cynaroides TaxID=273540 RepID=A0A9Q0KMF6_9MAGN|nr:hypothetical protein NE237_006050 [Protea cynaroides]
MAVSLSKDKDEAKQQPQEAPIHGDVLEEILTHLTLLDLLAASRVSKVWRIAVTSSLLISPRVKPWLIIHALHPRNHSPTSTSAFDPASRVWLSLNTGNLPTAGSEIRSSHSQNILYTFSTRTFSFSFDAFHLMWHHAEAPRVWRQNPIIARFGCHVIIAGGTCDYVDDDPLAVEMYDTESRRWEMCGPMPVELKDSATSTWLSAAATDRTLYLLEKRSLVICSFDAETKTWGPTFNLTLDVFHSIIGVANKRLVLVGLIGEPDELQGVGLWEVDQVSYECRKIGEMPEVMVESLRNENSMFWMPCASMEGDFIYVYNPANPEWIFFCELKERMCQWSQVLNPTAKDHNRMERFVFTCGKMGMYDLEKAVITGRTQDKINGGIGQR